MPDGSSVKRAAVSGLEFAKLALEELSNITRYGNDGVAGDRDIHQVVAQMNVPLSGRSIKRIFQIAYDEESRLQRAELLFGCGYGVISVLGNEAAKLLLSSIQHYDLFIVGPDAPEETRREIVDWLKENYPLVKILAMNPPDQQVPKADYNAEQDGPENWLPIVKERLINSKSIVPLFGSSA